jgi:anti-sigma factor RsiW
MTGALVREEDLHAFIDGELDEARTREIAELMVTDRAVAEKVQAFRVDKARLLEHYEPLLERPIPEAWLKRIEAARKPAHRIDRIAWRKSVYALAASVLALVVGWSTYRVMLEHGGEGVVDEAIAARNVADTGTAVDAAKISAALGLRVKLPDLTRAGYAFAGAAIMPKSGTTAVKLDYRDRDNRMFTLYLKPSSGQAHFEMTARGRVRVCLWQDDVLATVMVGEMSAAEMLRVASLAYNGLYF